MELFDIIILTFLSFLIGYISVIFGIGGGLFNVPILVFFFNIPIPQAVAASLVSVAALSAMSVMSKIRHGFVNIRVASLLEPFSIFGMLIGVFLVAIVKENNIRIIFTILSFIMATNMLIKTFHSRKKDVKIIRTKNTFYGEYRDQGLGKTIKYNPKNIMISSPFSFLAGLLSALVGIGGGVVLVPIMNFLCRMPIKASVATSNFILFVSSACGAFSYMIKGFIIYDIAGAMVLGSMTGAYFGMKMLVKIKPKIIQVLFAVLMYIISIKFLTSVVGN